MNEREQKRFYETLESVAIAQGLAMLLRQAEDSGPGDEAHQAMIEFFRSLLAKYKRRTGTLRLKTDAYGQVQIIDNELRTFNKN